MIWTEHALHRLANRCPGLTPTDVEGRSEAVTRNQAYLHGCFIDDEQADVLYDRQDNLFLVVRPEFLDDVVVTVIRPAPRQIISRHRSRRWQKRRERWDRRC